MNTHNIIIELEEMLDEALEDNENLKNDLIITLERLVDLQGKYIDGLECSCECCGEPLH